jgi:outer membrane protein TolC
VPLGDLRRQEAALAAPEATAPLDVRAALRVALRHNPELVLLRQAAEVARAQARTFVGLRDPELRVSYGEGERVTDRVWLVPREELMPYISFPYDNRVLLTSNPEDMQKEKDPRVQKWLIAPDEADRYFAVSSNRFHGVTTETDVLRIALRLFLPNLWTAGPRADASRAAFAAAAAELSDAERRVRAEVKRRFAEILYLEQDLALVAQLAEVRQKTLALVTDLVERGQATALDSAAALQRHAQAVADRGRLEADLAAARSALSSAMGHPAGGVPLSAEGLLPSVPDEEALRAERLKRVALENRYDVAAAYWRCQAAMAVLREARAARLPWFTFLEGSYGRTHQRDRRDAVWEMSGGSAYLDPFLALPMDEVEETEWRVDAAISVPLFSLGPGATRVQRAEYARALALLGESVRQAGVQVQDAALLLQRTEARASPLRADVEQRSLEARQVLAQAEARPDLNPLDIEKVREATVQMERTLAQYQYDRRVALIRLEESLGCEAEAVGRPVPQPHATETP